MLSLLIKIQNINSLELIWLDLVCEAKLGNIISVKSLINTFFNLVTEIEKKVEHEQIQTADEFFSFDRYLSENYTTIKPDSRCNYLLFNILGYSMPKRFFYYCYLRQVIAPLLNPNFLYEFYIVCDFYITPSFNSLVALNSEEITSEYYKNMFDRCLSIDLDYSIIFLSYVTVAEEKVKCFETLIDYFISVNKIYLLKKFINNKEASTIILDILHNRCKIYESDDNKLLTMITKINISSGEFTSTYLNQNYFKFLYNYYYENYDYYNSAKILFCYFESVEKLITKDKVNIKVCHLKSLYEEMTEVLSLAMEAMRKIQNSLEVLSIATTDESKII